MSSPMEHEAVNLLKELLDIPSPSGREERMAALVRQKIEAIGYIPETDPAGNVMVRLDGGAAKRSVGSMIIAAHLDEIAMVVTGVEPDGRLKVDRSGGLFPFKIGECVVDIIGDNEILPGVLSIGTVPLVDAVARAVTWPDVRIITGYSAERLRTLGVRVGSTAVPNRGRRGPVILGEGPDPLLGAWTFDDRAGVATLLRLLKVIKEQKMPLARPTLIAFTVHEEGGAYGAKILAQRERPEIFLAVDGCPIRSGSSIVADGRPATWSHDAKGHYDQRLIRQLLRCGTDVGVEVQTAAFKAGSSDASAAYDVGAAPRVAVIGHPRENSHGFEVIRLSVMDNLLKVLGRFVQVVE